MCCSSSDAVSVLNTNTRKLKDGKLKRYKTGIFGNKWKDCFAVLYSDSTFLWYDEKDDVKPLGSILLKDVLPYMCVGLMTDRMPIRRPNLPANCSVHHLIGIGMDPRAEKVFWFLFDSDSDLESWFNEIMKTLPKPPNAENPQKVNGDDDAYKSAAPPPYEGGQPTHNYQSHPVGSPPNFNSYPQQYNGGYGGMQPGGQTTVIVGQQPDNTGAMLATGMIGGALLGYGLGSCFAPGFGMHGGFGGGYVSNNETTVNNYYGGEPPAENGDADYQNGDGGGGDIGGGDFGGADFGDIGGGGNFGGGGDFGGGFDFGGGDFGGGDF